MPYFSGQGKVYVAPVTAGAPGAFRFVGNVPELNVQLETDVLEHKESTSGQRLTDVRLIRGKSAKFNFALEEFNKDNLALALYGAATTIASGSVTGEVLPSAIAVGDYVRTKFPKISTVVVKDSAGTPATLVLDTDYEITSADHGTIKFLNVTGFTQPFKVDYAYAEVSNINMFTQGFQERWVKFDGLNTVDANKPVLVELYKVSFDPTERLDLIADDIQKFPLAGNALYDDSKESDTTLGQFGRVVII